MGLIIQTQACLTRKPVPFSPNREGQVRPYGGGDLNAKLRSLNFIQEAMGSQGGCLSRTDSCSKEGLRKANVVQEDREKKSESDCSVKMKGNKGLAWIRPGVSSGPKRSLVPHDSLERCDVFFSFYR